MPRVDVETHGALLKEYLTRTFTEKTLQLVAFGVMCEICCEIHKPEPGFLQIVDAYITNSWSRNAIAMAAKWYCPAELKQEIRHPADWWAAFKERFAPAWFKRRWPVSYRVYKIYEMFPEVAWPKNKGHRMNVFISGPDLDAQG